MRLRHLAHMQPLLFAMTSLCQMCKMRINFADLSNRIEPEELTWMRGILCTSFYIFWWVSVLRVLNWCRLINSSILLFFESRSPHRRRPSTRSRADTRNSDSIHSVRCLHTQNYWEISILYVCHTWLALGAQPKNTAKLGRPLNQGRSTGRSRRNCARLYPRRDWRWNSRTRRGHSRGETRIQPSWRQTPYVFFFPSLNLSTRANLDFSRCYQ